MSDSSQPPLSEDEARQQRQNALSSLAHNKLAAPAASSGSTSSPSRARDVRELSRTPAGGTRRRPPSWLTIVSVVLALVVVAGIVLHQMGHTTGRSAQRQSTPVSMVLIPSAHGLACILDTAWSPDGRQIAVIGYQGQCPSDDPTGYNYQPGVLQIYAVASGQLVHSLLPDAAVLKLPGIPAVPAGVQPTAPGDDISKLVVDYTHVLWSPDGQQIALTFDIMKFSATTNISMPAYGGLVLVDADGTHERAALLPETNQQNTALQWTISRVGSPDRAAKQEAGDFITLPPALTYSWNSAGQLVADIPLSAAPSAATPAGDPDGGSSFTIWQPGQIGFYTEGFPDSNNGFPVSINPGIYSLQTAFAAWSPDGRYLIDSVSLFGIVHPAGEPTPTAAGLHALLGTGTTPTLPIPDRALQNALVAMNSGGNGGGQDGVDIDEIAWSPSGHVLAAFPDPVVDDHPGVSSAPVTLYNSASGKTIETLRPYSSVNAVSENSDSNPSTLYWSADGTHLLAYSDQQQTITIWGPIMPPQGASA